MIKNLPKNNKGRDFVVGDMHGCFNLFQKGLKEIQFNKETDRIISVGDLIDRGPDSFSCLKLINEPWFHVVKGNHEQLMEDWMTSGPTGAWWMRNGGGWFFDFPFEKQREIAETILPKIQALPWIITVEGPKKFHVIHAELPLTMTDEDLADEATFRQQALRHTGDGETCIWGRFAFGIYFAKQIDVAKATKIADISEHSRIFCGHTPLQKPLSINGMTNIDTGAFLVGSRNWAGLTFVEPKTEKTWKIF